jgi:RHS repeat-associated protein
VVITSLRDDAVTGDTNGDGASSAPSRGDWTSIRLYGGDPNYPDLPDYKYHRYPANVFDYTDIRYGGWGTGGACANYGAITASDSGVRFALVNSTISDALYAGVSLYHTNLDGRGYAGIYNSRFASSGCGVSMWTSASADVIGNTFSGPFTGFTFSTALVSVDSRRLRFWFNTSSGQVAVGNSSTPPTRQQADVRYNALLGGIFGGAGLVSLQDWSANWFGHDANAALPACIDPDVAASSNPSIATAPSPDCPAGQNKVVGYSKPVLPALSASAQVLPEALREAAAPRFGPVNAYSGGLTYQVTDLGFEDAGKRLDATRTYRSDRVGGGDAGQGWSTSYSEALSADGGLATFSLPDGTSLPFVTDQAAGYTPSPGVSADFTTSPAGSLVTTPGQTTYEFNPAGELTGLTLGDAGHRVDVQRSGGKVSRVTGVSGRYISFAREDGRVSQIADSTGRAANLSYAGGRLAAVSGVDGLSERYEYNAEGKLTKVITPGGRVRLAAGYDTEGRVAWVEQQGQGRSTFSYDSDAARTTITLLGGSAIVQGYDWAGRLVTERVGSTGRHVVYDGEGRVVANIAGVPDVPMEGYAPSAPATFYDGKGDPVLTVDPTGRFEATTFNDKHKPLVTKRSDDSTIARTYDTQGRLATVTDPRGKRWSYSYNSRGQVTSQENPLGRTRTVTYAVNGDAAAVTDETGATWNLGYDPLGRRTSLTDPLNNRREITYTSWDGTATVRSARGGVATVTYDADRQQASATDPTGRKVSYEHDTAGRLTAVVDAAGGRTTTEYDALGRPATVTDARGSVFRQTYTAEGWTATSTDPTGAVTSYSHDPAGRVHRTTDPLSQVTQTGYDRAGRATDVWTPDGGHTSYGYDPMGRQNTLTTPRSKVWKTDYDAAGHAVKWTDPLTWTVLAVYDDIGRPTSRTDQNGVVTTIAYNDTQRKVTTADQLGTLSVVTRDAGGRITSETDGAGAATSYGYDADGNVTTITDPAGTRRVEYDLAARPTAEIDPLNRRTTGSYDAVGRLAERTHPDTTTDAYQYDAVGNLATYISRTGATWGYAYDPANRLTTATDPLGAATRYTYDRLGRQTSVTDPAGVVANTAYDPVSRPAVRWDASGASWITGYDPDGNVSKTIDPAGITWTFTYNNRGELTRKQWGTAAGSPAYDYTYDKVGRVLTRNDPYRTSYEYDGRGRLTAQINGVGGRTTVGYDAADRVTTQTLPSGDAATWTYDPAGRMLTAADPLGNTSRYQWDAASQLTKITLPRGGAYTYGYDPAGRLESETDPLNKVTSFAYDGEGRLTSTTYPSGRIVTAAYDQAGRQTELVAGSDRRTFGYDPAGRITSATAPGTPTLAFAYDNRGLLVRSTNGFGDTTYGYDTAQRPSTVTPPNAPTSTYTYDTNRGLPATVRGATNVNFTNYDGAGQLKQRTTAAPSTGGTEGRGYDAAGRLTVIDGPVYDATITYHPDGQIATLTGSGSTPRKTSYGYDHAGRLTSETISQGTTTLSTAAYTWDGDGNRTSATRNGQPATTASYNLADQLTSTSDGTSYTYDPDGLQQTAGTSTYSYNGFGEPTGASTPSASVSYTRDGLGRTAARTAAGATTTFGYHTDTGTLAASQTGAGPLTTMVRTPGGQLLAEATTGAATQQAWANVHGDLVALKNDTNSTITWQADYDPFGTVTGGTGTAPTPLGFQTAYTDPVTGLVDMGARQYSPATGRFTTRDSIVGVLSAPISLHRYLYANADPINFLDPDGHWPDFIDSIVQTVANVGRAIVDFAVDTWDSITSSEPARKLSTAWTAITSSEPVRKLSAAWTAITSRETWAATGRQIAETWRAGENLAKEVAAGASEFWDEHGDQIKAAAASIGVGVVVFAGCEAVAVAVTAGTATPLCATLAGAAGGGIYGNMTCPEQRSKTMCTATGALAGGLAGLTGGLASSAGAGLFVSGAIAGFTGDATDQILTTGAYDPVRGAAATLGGGALSWIGGRTLGRFIGRTPKMAAGTTARGTTGDLPDRVFYSVQDQRNAARLASGGQPWPTGLQRSNLGEGLYAWGERSQAQAYLDFLQAPQRGYTGLSIVEARIKATDYNSLRTLDLRTMSDPDIDAWMDKYSLYGQGLPHDYQHVIRQTGNFGPEYYFAKQTFPLLRIETSR